ncbi:hypothetical protein TNCV_275311 [Trichonephila clavipes]|nr:hypothetical protein TNCV_275311 [Trichonephila clavipes]
MIRGPQATRAPTCETSPTNRVLIPKKKGPEGILIQGPFITSYASGANDKRRILKARARSHSPCVRLCKEPLPAPGNMSNEKRYKEKDLATTEEEKKVGTGGEGESGGEKTRGGKKKIWLDDGCIVIL